MSLSAGSTTVKRGASFWAMYVVFRTLNLLLDLAQYRASLEYRRLIGMMWPQRQPNLSI